MTVEVPHFALPFRYEGGRPAVVEQGDDDDIFACVEAILRYRQGERPDLPEFGLADLAFTTGPVDIDAIAKAIDEWEDRADVLIEEHPDRFDELVRDVRVAIARGETDGQD